MFLKINPKGSVVYPYTLQQMRQDFTNTSFTLPLLAEDLIDFGIFELIETQPPSFNPVTQRVDETTPALIEGVWTQQWSLVDFDAETIAVRIKEAKDKVEIKIKESRDLRKAGGTYVSNKWFHSDDASRIQQLGLVLLGSNVPAVPWKTMDGTYITMTQSLAGAIFQATLALDMALFAHADTHIAAMKASSDPETYDYTTGWPTHYVKVGGE